MSSGIVWRNPPEPPPSRAGIVLAELRAKPGEWAWIESALPKLLPWWLPLAERDDVEMKIVHLVPGQSLGMRDVYARFIGEPA